MARIKLRYGMPNVQLTKAEFVARFRDRFFDPAFEKLGAELDRIIDLAWDGYNIYRKNPRKKAAGKGFKNPKANLPVEWLAARGQAARARRQTARSAFEIADTNG